MLVYDESKDEKIEYRLVTSEESDVSKGLISTTSPIGRSLMGKRVGDTATEAGLVPAAIVPMDVKSPELALMLYIETLFEPQLAT